MCAEPGRVRTRSIPGRLLPLRILGGETRKLSGVLRQPNPEPLPTSVEPPPRGNPKPQRKNQIERSDAVHPTQRVEERDAREQGRDVLVFEGDDDLGERRGCDGQEDLREGIASQRSPLRTFTARFPSASQKWSHKWKFSTLFA